MGGVWATTTYPRSNYVGCFSATGIATVSSPLSLFNYNVARRMKNLTDGISKTVAVSEVITGVSASGDSRGMWWEAWGCQYSYARTPNSNIPDSSWSSVPNNCGDTASPARPKKSAPCDASLTTWDPLYSARSNHSSGVNVGMADGAVLFINNNISLSVWQAIGSINGGETADATAF